MLETLDVHEPEHPGFLRHPLEGRQVGVDGGRGPAGVAQQLGNAHDVMPAQAAPAAGVGAGGTEHPGHNPEKRGHGLPAAGGIQGEQIGPGRIHRHFTAGQRRQKFLIQRDRCCQKIKVLSVIRHQAHVRLRSGRKRSGVLRENRG